MARLSAGLVLAVLTSGIFSLSTQAFAENSRDPKNPKTEKASECASLLSEAIPTAWVAKMIEHGKANDPASKRLRDIVQRSGFSAAALNRDILLAHHENYTFELSQGPITNQKQSGRCWIFAGLNMMRSILIAEGRVPESFEFSENYLHFFNMLEKSNRYLERVIDRSLKNSENPTAVSQNELKRVLHPDLGDGGWYEYFMFLVSKYGVVPKDAMPDSRSAEGTAVLLTELKKHLASVSSQLLTLTKMRQKSPQKISAEKFISTARELKQRGMEGAWKILATHLGDPPATFNFRERGKPEKSGGITKTPASTRVLTPQQFARDFVQFKVDDYIVVTAYPRRKVDAVFEMKNTAIGPTGTGQRSYDLRFLNVSPDRLEQLTVSAIEGGQPVWFAADVHRDIDYSTGIMHPNVYEREALYNFNANDRPMKMTRSGEATFGLTSPNHAMVLTGFDRPDPNGPVIKFKNENSWGDGPGSKGIFHLYREWFHSNVYQIIVHKKFLSAEEIKLWESAAQQIPERGDLF